jgi:hypothetical protein
MRAIRSSGSVEGVASNHDSYSDFVEFPDPARVTPGGAKRVGPAPKCRSSAFTEALEKSFRRTFRIGFGGKP